MAGNKKFSFNKLLQLTKLQTFWRQNPQLGHQLIWQLLIFFILFFLTFGGPLDKTNVNFLFLIALLIFAFKSSKTIYKNLEIHPAVYLAVFFAGAFLQNLFLSFITKPASADILIGYPELFLLQLSWLLMFWSACLFFANETEGRQGYIVLGLLFLFLAHHLLIYDHPINQWIFYLLLFASLIKKTNWLENLSRAELGIYLLFAFVLYVHLQRPDFFNTWSEFADSADDGFWAYSLPFFLYYVAKIYLLVIMIKIPLVLIYNYAPISRKLWIASFFQSTIPQFVQLVLLLFIFFLFISGWQADNLRQQIYTLCDQAAKGQVKTIQVKKMPLDSLYDLSQDPRVFSKNLSVVALGKNAQQQKLLFFRSQKLERDSLFVLTVDSLFLKELFSRTRLIIGSGILAYKLKPKNFLAYFYRLKFWQSGTIRINPLGLINPFLNLKKNSDLVIWPVRSDFDLKQSNFWWRHIHTYPLIVGRIIFPLNEENTYFAMDIYYDLKDLFQWNFFTQVLLVLIFLFFLINSLVIRRVVKLGTQINQLIIKRIDQLREAVRAISAGNLDYHIQLKGDDEFTEFANHFNRMSHELKRFMKEAAEKERLDQELKIAHDVQLKMLPARLPAIPGYSVAADLTTANEVGGDFYDLFPINEHQYLIAIGDVSGKGMSAAFYMAQIISLLRYSRPFISKLKELVLNLNDFLMNEVLENNIFVTATIGILDIRSHTFQFIRAGHTLPIIIKNQIVLQEIESKGMGLGVTHLRKVLEQNLELKKIKLKQDETLILYTDGFTEAVREDKASDKILFGEDRFWAEIRQAAQGTPEEMIKHLKKMIDSFYGETPRFDDQTILILKKLNQDGQTSRKPLNT